MKTLYDEELLDIVTAANIAGHLESCGTIYLPDDEELLRFIDAQMSLYDSAVDTAMSENPKDADLFNWIDWIDDALRRKYGTEVKNEQPNV